MPQKELIPRPEIATTYTKSMTAQMAGVAGAGDSGAAAASGAAVATDGGAGRASAATDPGSTPIIYR